MSQKSGISKKVQVVLDDLKSANEEKISKAIVAIQSVGKPEIIPFLVELLHSELSEKNRKELLNIFNNLIDSEAVEFIMEEVKDDKNQLIRGELLNTIWNSKLDYTEFLPDFVDIAIQGDFSEALECLTIIENLEGPFTEQLLMECQLLLKEYIEDPAPKDSQKAAIISDIALFIRDVEEYDEDGFIDMEDLD